MPLPLSKKTKIELMEDYNKLLAQHEDLQRIAALVSDPQSVALLAKASDYTSDHLTQTISDLKNGVNAALNDLADKLITEAQKFSELQKATELAKKSLELHYHIQVAAETLDRIIQEHKNQTAVLEEEKKVKQREWSREQEEREYAVNLKIKRQHEEFAELKAKQDRVLKEREETLKQQEQELVNLRVQAAAFPAQLDKALAGREQEIAKRIHSEFDGQLAAAKKDWLAQEQLYKLSFNGMEDRLKDERAENVGLKNEIEKANKRVQELTMKIIESGTRSSCKTEEASEN